MTATEQQSVLETELIKLRGEQVIDRMMLKSAFLAIRILKAVIVAQARGARLPREALVANDWLGDYGRWQRDRGIVE